MVSFQSRRWLTEDKKKPKIYVPASGSLRLTPGIQRNSPAFISCGVLQHAMRYTTLSLLLNCPAVLPSSVRLTALPIGQYVAGTAGALPPVLCRSLDVLVPPPYRVHDLNAWQDPDPDERPLPDIAAESSTSSSDSEDDISQASVDVGHPLLDANIFDALAGQLPPDESQIMCIHHMPHPPLTHLLW